MLSYGTKFGNDIIDFKDLEEREIDPDFLEAVYSMFASEVTRQLEELKEFIDTGDCQSVMQHGHNIKGMSLNLAATRMSELAAHIETAGLQENLAGLNTILTELTEEFSRVSTILNSLFAA